MTATQQGNFRTTALEAALLSTPFGIQTNWQVITGAPSCGKTTLINLLIEKGFQTVPESAREYMEGEIARGRTIAEVHEEAPTNQRVFMDIQLKTEAGLQANELLFLDGAAPHTLAWYRVFGLDPNEILAECFHHRYASVFILDRLPLELDGFRYEQKDIVGFLDEWIARDFTALGYEIQRVPVLPPEERLAFILERVPKPGQDINTRR